MASVRYWYASGISSLEIAPGTAGSAPERAPVLAERVRSRSNWSAVMGEGMGRGGCGTSWQYADGGGGGRW